MRSAVLKTFRAAPLGALRAMFFGSLFVSVVGAVSVGVSSIPSSDSLEEAAGSLFLGTVVFHFLGAIVVIAGALWGLLSIPLLSLPWLKRRAHGRTRAALAGIMGLFSGIVAGYIMGRSVLVEPLFHISSTAIGVASSPFIAWAAGWNSQSAERGAV